MISLSPEKLQDEAAFKDISTRFYDVCNGCRRCFNLCPSFDVLFKETDEVDGDVEKLPQNTLDRVVDLCYYCKLCYNHCPYCPPHHYELDFPRLMMWGKNIRMKKNPPGLRERMLANVELMGRVGSLLAPLTNWANRQPLLRWVMEKIIGIHRARLLPLFHRRSFASVFTGGRNPKSTSGEKVALFYTCYVNRHDPGIGKAAVEVLEKNGVEVICPPQECCGMPYLDYGDFDSVREKARRNIQHLADAVDAGYKIVSPMPTCSLMLKKEYPELVPGENTLKVARNSFDLCEYLMTLEKDNKLVKDFVSSPGKVAYQLPCHLKDQNIGLKSRDLMKLIPGTEIEVIDRCSGHDGAFGVKSEFYALSLTVGKKAFRAIEKAKPDAVTSDCPLSGLALTQETGLPNAHPVQILHRAYGLDKKEDQKDREDDNG